MGQLSEIAKSRNPYLTLEVGESTQAIYKGFKMVPSTFDPTKDNYRFLLEVEVNIDGKPEKQMKFWDTGSNKIAIVFDTIKEGSKVQITKNSLGKDKSGEEKISWEVKPI